MAERARLDSVRVFAEVAAHGLEGRRVQPPAVLRWFRELKALRRRVLTSRRLRTSLTHKGDKMVDPHQRPEGDSGKTQGIDA